MNNSGNDRLRRRGLAEAPTTARPAASNRFLSVEETALRGTPRPRRGAPAASGTLLFPEGPWQMLRVQLEAEGWDPSQIDLVRDQLRQGWSLAVARHNVARLSGRCPINARQHN